MAEFEDLPKSICIIQEHYPCKFYYLLLDSFLRNSAMGAFSRLTSSSVSRGVSVSLSAELSLERQVFSAREVLYVKRAARKTAHIDVPTETIKTEFRPLQTDPMPRTVTNAGKVYAGTMATHLL